MARICGATQKIKGGKTLTCTLDPGHPGRQFPTHSDGVNEWGDLDLMPLEPLPGTELPDE